MHQTSGLQLLIKDNSVVGRASEHCDNAACLIQAARDPRLPNLYVIASLEQDPRFNGS
jgi:hypothetical protein